MSTSVVVFVVEDDPLIQQILEDTVSDGRYAVRAARTGEEASALLDEIGANFQALITDVDLAPGKLTGWDVARHARELMAGLPVIYMTGASGNDWASKGVPNSMLMNKPFTSAQVVTAVSQLINERASHIGDDCPLGRVTRKGALRP